MDKIATKFRRSNANGHSCKVEGAHTHRGMHPFPPNRISHIVSMVVLLLFEKWETCTCAFQ